MAVGLALLATVGLVLWLRGHRPPPYVADNPPFSVLKQVDSGMCKVIWATFQIVSTIQWNLNVVFGPPFSSFLDLLSMMQLDWLSLDCATGKSSFFTRVMVVSITPIVLAGLNWVVFAARRSFLSCSFFYSPDRVRQLAAQHSFAFLLLTYLVLPPCSMVSQRSERQCDQRIFILF